MRQPKKKISTDLRRKAEKQLKAKKGKAADGTSSSDVRALIHELEVHQIELEMQNEELRNAHEELAKSRDAYQNLYEVAPVGYFTLDKEGIILQANLTGAGMLERVRSSLLKKKFHLYITPDCTHTFNTHLKEAFKNTNPQRCRIQCKRKDGTALYVDLHSQFQESEAGPVLRTALIDVTGLIAAENALRESEEKFRSAFANATIGFALRNIDGRFIDANAAYCSITGYSIEELRALAFPQLIYPDDYEAHLRLMKQMKSRQINSFVTENRYVRRDAAVVWVHKTVSLVRNAAGVPQWIIVLIEDISERKQTEDALRQNQADLDRAQEVGQVGSWRLDVQRNVLTWSDENHRIFNVPHGAPLTYERFLEIVHPDDRQYVDTEWKAALIGKPYDIEHRLLVDDRVKWVREKAYLEFEAEGRLKGGFGITQDITKRKLMEEMLRHRTHELEQLSATLEQRVLERTDELLVLNRELQKSQVRLKQLSRDLLNAQEQERKRVAWELHDSIGSSLTAVKFRIESALREGISSGSHALAALEKVIPVVQTAVMEAKRIQMNLRPSILDDLGIVATTRWFCDQFRETYPKIQLEQHVKIEEDDVPASLKTVIFRIFQEGLNNAARHSNSPVVSLYLWKSNRTIKLLIRDKGLGLDLSELQSRNPHGRGLGLESMRERTELSGGRFSIATKRGGGTTIRANWPINISNRVP